MTQKQQLKMFSMLIALAAIGYLAALVAIKLATDAPTNFNDSTVRSVIQCSMATLVALGWIPTRIITFNRS